jgi:NAD(P)-dependent dehydrogenase (short-subunit alcohol dehydrogenase family)
MTGVVLVTGASRGIGRHLAGAFEEAGYAVERGSRALAPVTDRDAVERWVDDVLARHGRLDVVVNNAGVIDDEVPLGRSDPDQWWETVEVNLRGPYLVTRAALPALEAAAPGRVLNVSSGAAYAVGDEATAYNVSKGALARLTSMLAANPALRAFDLAPGVVRTDMTAGMRSHAQRTEWTDPADVARLALALASGRLDDWSGRLVRAGVDTPESLVRRARAGLQPRDRTLTLQRWGDDDPLP